MRVFINLCFVIILLSACGINEDSSKEKPVEFNKITSNLTDEEYKPSEEEKKQSGDHTATKLKNKAMLEVPLIKQNPELKYGCEVTSLTMVLHHAGVDVDKMELAKKMPKDDDQVKKTKQGDILEWGDPNEGFVGDVTGEKPGYAMFDEPMVKLMKEYLPNKTINLTGSDFDQVLKQVSNGKPVIVWTTGDYKLPDRWESWRHHGEKITTPLDLHAVVLVGYDQESVYINDPLSGKKAAKVDKGIFLESWKALKRRAVSYE
ncbi:peptidase C39 [Pontibacillus yanchengensis]|uniref:Peptidase C39 n=2 Tax=Pontibacillus yanchengensis TaxID=462910 RepID=A0ACC7VE67_9BACI|nr:C39 family peptidase [Pontibacillus yanchengensis]MYL35179.1 peptidase C39 [Pontibacillus yanchengensis]MYL52454.1 peptidase C39 [Pontibacillus yanchengensis]